MPGKVGVKIKAGRNLPVMDRSSDTTDAYVEIKLGTITHKTDVCRKTLNPQWNSDWFRFEVDDAELQDEPLQIRLMDHDTYSANDAIGKVNISLNPLCLENVGHSKHGKGSVMSGWIPVFDTMHGIRGEVNVIVKVDLFSDANKFRQSSCGVQFFHSQNIPHGYRLQVIHGFVEELVVNDDPEYQWIDKIRTPRASNEARQVVFLKLSGQVQRKIGLKAINLGANAVVGYTQCFDLEGDVGVVARGIGTAVTLSKIQEPITQQVADNVLLEERTLKYLEFLMGGSDKHSNDNNDSSSLHDSVHNILGIDAADKTLTKVPSMLLSKKWRPSSRDETIFEDLEENEGVKQLLLQEDNRGERNNKKIRHHVRKITRSSRNTIAEKFSAFKTKLYEEKTDRSRISLNSSLSDVSYTESCKSSLSDLRDKIRYPKKTKFCRSVSDGTSMASLLIRSLLHDPSLDSISETYNTGRNSPNSCLKSRKQFKSESMLNLPQNNIEARNDLISRQHASNISISTNSSSSATTEENFSDEEDSSQSEVLAANQETLDTVLKSVDQLEGHTDVATDLCCKKKNEISVFSENTQIHCDNCVQSQLNDHKLTQINYASDFAPSVLELIMKNINIAQADSNINQSEAGTITEEPRTTLLHDLKGNLTDKFHNFQEHIHLSHAGEEKKNIKKHGMLEAAMETILIDKANTLGVETIIPSDICEELDKQMQPLDHPKQEKILYVPKFHLPFFHKNKEIKSETGLIGTAVKTMLIEQVNFTDEIGEHCYETETQTAIEASPNSPKESDPTETENPFAIVARPRLKHFNIPAISLTDLTDKTYQFNEQQNFYLSEPQLLSPGIQSMPPSPQKSFMSLTNLITNDEQSVPSHDNTNPTVVDPISSNSDASFNTQEVLQNTNFPLLSNDSSLKTNARNNYMSYTNLSTNKVPMLGPSPFLGHDRSELSSVTPAVVNSTNVKLVSSGHIRADSAGSKMAQSPVKLSNPSTSASLAIGKDTGICRRSSDSDLSVTPKGNSICVASERLAAATTQMRINITSNLKNQEALDMLEYPFLTMSKYPHGFIVHLGATVAARSVKLLERVPNPDEPETRDSWWTELRMEIRSHARSLGCNVILGYSEVTTISDDVCVLSATGTAAVLNMSYSGDIGVTDSTSTSKKDLAVSSLDDKDVRNGIKVADTETGPLYEMSSSYGGTGFSRESAHTSALYQGCFLCHVPYSQSSVPFNVKMRKCAICHRGKVPDVLLATIDIPESLQITGRGCFIQAEVVRAKRDLRSESNAKEMSDGLPFLEYELHRVLINKLKAKGMNAIFGLKAHVSIGEKLMALVATGTALFLTALPEPSVPKIVGGNSWTDTARLNELQKSLQDTVERNREIYQLKIFEQVNQNGKHSDTDDSEDEMNEMDLNTGNKDTCVLEVDDVEDLEIIAQLMEPCPPEGFHVVNTQVVPGLHDLEVVKNLQMFTQVWKAKLSIGQNTSNFPKHFQRLLQTIIFKLRSMVPCAICDLKFRLDLPESDEIQILVTGMALGLGQPSKLAKIRRKTISLAVNNTTNGNASKKKQDDELIFNLEEDQMQEAIAATQSVSPIYGNHSFYGKRNSPYKANFNSSSKHLPLRDRYGVDVTPLSYVPGGKIEKYLGNLNFFFIRESTSVRENGGISGFVHSFITEVLAIVRAHVSALGGNAIVSFYMTELILVDNPHKNQGQCLVSIGGDVVHVSYFTDD